MQQNKSTSEIEFIALMASLMSLVALAIDALLPALDIIGDALKVSNPNDNQSMVFMIFIGLGFGQLVFGPLSDAIGRKPVIYYGLVLFLIGSLICVFAQTLSIMLLGRIVQGLGLSSPRSISTAMVRDKFEGNHMAKVMSFVTVIFIIVPTIAPALGKFILETFSWQAIFYVQLLLSVLVLIWFIVRQPETLKDVHKKPFTSNRFLMGVQEIFKRQQTIAYTVISGLISGAFIAYLSTSQQIFEVQYGLKETFPYIFAGLAIAVGFATFINGTLVVRFGMRKLIHISLINFCLSSLLYIVLYHSSSNPPIMVLLTFFSVQLCSVGFLFGNLKALAMQPIGHIAGIGAAITGFISTMMAVPISKYIGGALDNQVLPIFYGFFICGLIALMVFYAIKKFKLE